MLTHTAFRVRIFPSRILTEELCSFAEQRVCTDNTTTSVTLWTNSTVTIIVSFEVAPYIDSQKRGALNDDHGNMSAVALSILKNPGSWFRIMMDVSLRGKTKENECFQHAFVIVTYSGLQ
ncbi:hypothetical protein NPIL_641901 [Nephila pilipes]|uniref:Uncharacterized protein n=1 Tax=Nephila pilipes TaxID=299642 RepID=A0A8X6MP53_NEPPI|nr:hypothetical protein NPIL_641901 [Nephila pilipes]